MLYSPERHGRNGESGVGHCDAGADRGYRCTDNDLADVHAASVWLGVVSVDDGANGVAVNPDDDYVAKQRF
ncbi:hypothetical protein I547_2567 [Mycobacterium kansasii 824]|nr:hypothetical protein I547_2567 [Mycobacterium kansasii 824]KEP44787.1 hypothetical protein MKSMC1_00280 [Mycobacterium kansasii]